MILTTELFQRTGLNTVILAFLKLFISKKFSVIYFNISENPQVERSRFWKDVKFNVTILLLLENAKLHII